jgi:hypothetical protein
MNKPEPIEQPDDGNARPPRLRRAILRKRVTAAIVLALITLTLAMSVYYQTAFLRRAGDWRWFWVGEAIVGAQLAYGIVQVLRKGP